MKTFVLFPLLSLALSLFLFSFTLFENKYPTDTPESYKIMWENEFIKAIDNDQLNADLESKFMALFDEVNEVDAQFNAEMG